MHPPDFWMKTQGREAAPVLRTLLKPLSWIYAGIAAWRFTKTRAYQASVPVLCVGNISLGGTGKTPLVRAIAEDFRQQGVDAHILSRGYGGRLSGPLHVNPQKHTVRDVGDEPLMLSQTLPVWISRHRAEGARAIEKAGGKFIIMDDGFQNPQLYKDVSLLVVDAVMGFGNGCVVPAGPLREPVHTAFKRCDALLVMRSGQADEEQAESLKSMLALPSFQKPVFYAWPEPEGLPPHGPLLAFAGIGRPEKFFEALKKSGAELVESVSFPDHHPYTQKDLEELHNLAHEYQARLVTTEKDWIRLDPQTRKEVLIWRIFSCFSEEESVKEYLDHALKKAKVV